MMDELQRFWYLLDTNIITINRSARHNRSAANVWADKLSRHLDSDDWRLDPVLFAELDARFEKHSIDRFATGAHGTLRRVAGLTRYHQGLESPSLPITNQRLFQEPRPRSNCPRRSGREGEKRTNSLTSRDRRHAGTGPHARLYYRKSPTHGSSPTPPTHGGHVA
jgi:hypothetical protein